MPIVVPFYDADCVALTPSSIVGNVSSDLAIDTNVDVSSHLHIDTKVNIQYVDPSIRSLINELTLAKQPEQINSIIVQLSSLIDYTEVFVTLVSYLEHADQSVRTHAESSIQKAIPLDSNILQNLKRGILLSTHTVKRKYSYHFNVNALQLALNTSPMRIRDCYRFIYLAVAFEQPGVVSLKKAAEYLSKTAEKGLLIYQSNCPKSVTSLHRTITDLPRWLLKNKIVSNGEPELFRRGGERPQDSGSPIVGLTPIGIELGEMLKTICIHKEEN